MRAELLVPPAIVPAVVVLVPRIVTGPAIVPEPPKVGVPMALLPPTETALPAANEPFTRNVPPKTLVAPVYVLALPRTHVPAPVLTTLVAPVPLLPTDGASVLAPIFVPVSVSVVGVLVKVNCAFVRAIAPVLVKFSGPLPDAWFVGAAVVVLVFIVKCRPVLAVAQVYCSVPLPLRVKLPAPLLLAPMPLLAPPSASRVVLKTPPVIDVAPV